MTERYAALSCGVYISYNWKLYYRTDPGDPFSEVDVGGDYGGAWAFPFDGSGAHYFIDLAAMLRYFIEGYMSVAPGDFTISMNKDLGSAAYGCLTFTKLAGAGAYLEISSRSDGATQNADACDEFFAVLFPDQARAGSYTAIWDALGSSDITQSRPSLGLVMPKRYLFKDILAREWRAAQDSDWSAQSTVYAAKVYEAQVTMRMDRSYPRGLVEGEYHQLVDFLDLAAQGREVAIIPDAHATAIKLGSNKTGPGYDPYGFYYGVLRKADAEWEPAPVDDSWDYRWDKEMSFVLTPTSKGWQEAAGYDLGGVYVTDIE